MECATLKAKYAHLLHEDKAVLDKAGNRLHCQIGCNDAVPHNLIGLHHPPPVEVRAEVLNTRQPKGTQARTQHLQQAGGGGE
jgi:hypothetical protein